jgi:hypothetical protein
MWDQLARALRTCLKPGELLSPIGAVPPAIGQHGAAGSLQLRDVKAFTFQAGQYAD